MINVNKSTEAILQIYNGLLVWCWNPTIKIGEYSWFGIQPIIKVIHKHNSNGISFDLYNNLVFMKTGCETKMIKTKSDVIWVNKFYWKNKSTLKKICWSFDIVTQWI